MSDASLLVADIGGTHARFALADPGEACLLIMDSIRKYAVADFPSLADAARHYLDDSAASANVKHAVFAVAGRIEGDEARITNHPWVISIARTRDALGLDRLELVNDFAAQAMAIARLDAADVIPIGAARWAGSSSDADRTYAVIGPGTGLGVGGLLRRNGRYHALQTEGGHVSFAPGTPEEIQLLQRLSGEFGRVSNERILSGTGLINLHRALSAIGGADPGSLRPEDITARARRRHAVPARHRHVLRGLRCGSGRPGAHAGGVGRRIPHRRHDPGIAAVACAFRFPPALRTQGPVLSSDGTGTGPGSDSPAPWIARCGSTGNVEVSGFARLINIEAAFNSRWRDGASAVIEGWGLPELDRLLPNGNGFKAIATTHFVTPVQAVYGDSSSLVVLLQRFGGVDVTDTRRPRWIGCDGSR